MEKAEKKEEKSVEKVSNYLKKKKSHKNKSIYLYSGRGTLNTSLEIISINNFHVRLFHVIFFQIENSKVNVYD